MKTAAKAVKLIFFVFLIFTVLIYSVIIYLDFNVSDEFKVKKGNDLVIDSFIPIKAVYNGSEFTQISFNENLGDEFEVNLKVLGVIPFSKVNVQVVDELEVAILGKPFGMKLYTEGVLVIDLTEVETENGILNPAKAAGIKKGDYILSVNGKKIYSNEDLSSAVEKSDGSEMDFLIKRNNKKLNLKLTAVFSKETGSYKIGIWIRDSSAGIGTLTFYSPANNVICGLGHGICDEDTGELLTLNSGEIVSAEIISVEKGSVGAPGQLTGKFGYKTLGTINLNCECGVYSTPQGKLESGKLTEVALKQEVTEGEAQILCCVNNSTPQFFSCRIDLRPSALHSKTQNMVVTITDKSLLELTGGIVQGMSGSPIIQNGKLVGAITHVLVDDPTKGYGIFAENMLETARSVEQSKKLKDAG